MNSKNKRSSALTAVAVIGSLLVIGGVLTLVMLRGGTSVSSTSVADANRAVAPTAPPIVVAPVTPVATSVPPEPAPTPGEAAVAPVKPSSADDGAGQVLTPRLLIDSDLGTGSAEFSAVALNEDSNRLLIADDGDRVFEFDLDDAGLPITPVRRVLPVRVGGGDVEGLAWIDGSTYVIAHENSGELTIVTFDDDASAITEDHLDRTVTTQIQEERGNGLEGVAVVRHDPAVEFAVVDERPPTLVGLGPGGQIVFSDPLAIGVTDVSDIFVSPTGHYSAITDEGRQIVNFSRASDGSLVVDSRVDLTLRPGRFEQPEGLVRSRDGQRLYVVGEVPGPGKLTFGFWSSE